MRFAILCLTTFLAYSTSAFAHDIWVQTNTNIVRTGDAVHIDLLLGNHGNDHRDFKIASKVATESIQHFEIVAPNGKKYDLKPDLIDLGYAPKEGFHSAKFVPGIAGLHVANQTFDGLLKHGKTMRGYLSAKTYFLASPTLDKLPREQSGFDKPLGHKIELIPETNPVVPMGPGVPIKVKLLFEGKPLANVKVSFIPRGTTLKETLDPAYERTTDQAGRAAFTPKTGTYYLIVARFQRDEKGDGYEVAQYTATMTVFVPERCACCDE